MRTSVYVSIEMLHYFYSSNDESVIQNDRLQLRLPKVTSSNMNNRSLQSLSPSPVPAAVLFPPITF